MIQEAHDSYRIMIRRKYTEERILLTKDSYLPCVAWITTLVVHVAGLDEEVKGCFICSEKQGQ